MFENLLLDNLTIGVLILNQEFEVKYLNRYMKEILKEYFNEIDLKYLKMNEALKKRLAKFDLKVKQREIKKDGEAYLFLEFHDVSDLKKLEKDLEEKSKSQNKLVAMLDTVQEFIFYLDSEGRLEYFNKAYAEYLNIPNNELYGKKEIEFFPEAMAKKCLENNEIAFEKGNFYEEEYLDGRWYQTFKSRVDLENDEYGILAMVKEITESKKRSLDLKEKAYKDILTGTYNRNFYEERLRSIFEEKTSSIFSMMLIDIDKFKEINDSKGHDIGDLVLKRLATILKNSIRKNGDYIIRMGGDELCIVIESNLEDLKRVYQRVESEIRKQNITEEFSFEISAGLVQRKSAEKLDAFYKRADVELYKIKKEKIN
ncbi:MAG: diguanylate cyclase [Cetobacterium sp.]|uniref:sensor domain-containing diguanylate cyclase n=1 Tax=Cetobacterium sp. ZOR0034 TaxID=1339239 RepID=UPI0006483966|nr:diguanylate cyclase [Cetobacterium sp. ZOR0034]